MYMLFCFFKLVPVVGYKRCKVELNTQYSSYTSHSQQTRLQHTYKCATTYMDPVTGDDRRVRVTDWSEDGSQGPSSVYGECVQAN